MNLTAKWSVNLEPYQKYTFSVLDVTLMLHDDATGSGDPLGPDERVWLRNWLKWRISNQIWDWPKEGHAGTYDNSIRSMAEAGIALSNWIYP